MAGASLLLQANLMKEYYNDFSKYSKGKKSDKKVAWVTSFTPIEILEALDIAYYYPESYAAVIAASGKEQSLLNESERQALCLDCCSYSCCFEGSITLEEGPRGIPPLPDVLIATNNQCNTLPNWWNILSHRYNVPLIVLDYPGENADKNDAYNYVTKQHKMLIHDMEVLCGKEMNYQRLSECISNSSNSIRTWSKVLGYMSIKEIKPTILFDAISFLITSRCKAETEQLYIAMSEEMEKLPDAKDEKIKIFWLGYPLWYHSKRYLSEMMEEYRITGSNYLTWWNLDYKGVNIWEQLFQAYNYTSLNLAQNTRTKKLKDLIEHSGAVGAITLHNKSCKCDFVSAKDIEIIQVEIEIDMIDREFMDVAKVERQMDILKETICID